MFIRQKIVLFSLIISLPAVNLLAQAPDTMWTRTYGGTLFDYGAMVQRATDSGYIMVGSSSSFGHGNYDVYLVRINEIGDTLWTKTYGGSEADEGNAVWATSDSGFIITGNTQSYPPQEIEVYLVKVDQNGDSIWAKTYGGSEFDEGNSVQQTTNGGYIIAGQTNSFGAGGYDIYVIRTNETGDTVWTRTYGGSNDEQGNSVQQTTDGGFLIVGYTKSYGAGNMDVYIIKIDGAGDTLWTRAIGGSSYEYAKSCIQTSEGQYLVVGSTNSYGVGNHDVYLIKLNIHGDTLWTRTFGYQSTDRGSSVIESYDSEYIISGNTYSIGNGGSDIYVIKVNSYGDTIWTSAYGTSYDEYGWSIQASADGGYVIAGTRDDLWEINADFYLLKLGSDQTEIEYEQDKINPKIHDLCQNYPNPFNANTSLNYSLDQTDYVTLTIYNIIGQRIAIPFEGLQQAGEHAVVWDASNYPSGVYFSRLETAEKSTHIKMVLLK